MREVQQILWREGEQAAFDKFASEIQARLPDHMPSDYATLWLRNAALTDETLRVAWDSRRINPMQIAVEQDRVQRMIIGLMSNPMADQSKLPEL